MKTSWLFCLITAFCNAQFYYFPKDQSPYVGGVENYYKDFHRTLIDKGLKPCENKDEMYNLRVVIYPDSTIKFVKDSDENDLLENKCASDLAKEVAKYQSGWSPAKINGEKIAAVTHFLIYPDELFENFKEQYNPYETMVVASYEGSGVSKFREKVAKSIDLSNFSWTGKFSLVVRFVIEKDGSVTGVEMEQSSGVKNFDEMIIKSIKKIKNKWTPGKMHNKTIKSNMRLPLTFTMN